VVSVPVIVILLKVCVPLQLFDDARAPYVEDAERSS
jgi:hypothetical protein